MSAVRRPGTVLLAVACVMVAGAVLAALLTMDSPAAMRDIRIDQGRHGDLQDLHDEVQAYWRAHDALPPDLATLAQQPGLELELHDPVSREPYGYEVTGATSYRLCAVFTTDTSKWGGKAHPVHTRDRWLHAEGPACFDRTVEPAAKAE